MDCHANIPCTYLDRRDFDLAIYSVCNFTGGEDYEGGVFEVRFTAGSSEAQLTVDINDDAVPEPTETFTARLRRTSNPGVCVGSDDTATVSIIDDDEGEL